MTVAAAAPRYINGELQRLLGSSERGSEAGSLLGIEHEFYLVRGGQPLDFRPLIHTLPIRGGRLDPGDTNSYRCASGISITCDEAEAEFASPPIEVRPGFISELDRWVRLGRAELRAALPADVEMVGASTHLSVAVPDALGDLVCFILARAFAPALMMVLDRRDSFGIDLRPRAGRVELCGEFADGPRLGAAAALLAGSVRACVAALEGAAAPLPPLLRVRVDEATERYGFRVLRRAFGGDLYEEGRAARLVQSDGGELTAQGHLERVWAVARAAPGNALSEEDGAAVEAIVTGRRSLGIEEHAVEGVPDAVIDDLVAPGSVFSSVVVPRERPGFEVRPRIVTWAFAVLEVRGAARTVFLCAPRPALPPLLAALDRGALDEIVGLYLTSPPPGRRLVSAAETHRAALWDEIGSPAGLLAEEYELDQLRTGAVGRALALGRLYPPRREALPTTVTAAAESPLELATHSVTDRAAPSDEGTLQHVETAPEASSSLLESRIERGVVAARPSAVRRGKFVPVATSAREEATEHRRPWLLLFVGLGLLLLVATVAWLLTRPEEAPAPRIEETPAGIATAVVTPSAVVSTPTATVTETAPTPAAPVLSGDYDVRLVVESNPGGHPADLIDVSSINLLVGRDRSVEPNPVRIELRIGDVTLVGATQIGPSFGAGGGSFTASGVAPYRGFSTSWTFEGNVTAGRGLSGTLTIGGDGRLPGGRAIAYRLDGTRR
ncbi:MAG: hypothetical protein K1X87_05880 [Dehalococcoidia bacterium]|nr:hypothetical protein [Dehalococcoidia bacterium]